MVVSELSYYDRASYLTPVTEVTPEEINKEYEKLEKRGRYMLRRSNVKEEDMIFIRSADMRYSLEEWEVRVPIPSGEIDASKLEQIKRDFHMAHHARYTYAREEEPIELVTLYLASIGVAPPFKPEKRPVGTKDPSKAEKVRRKVFIDENRGTLKIPVYERSWLMAGNRVEGPSIIEEPTSTIFIQPDWKAW